MMFSHSSVCVVSYCALSRAGLNADCPLCPAVLTLVGIDCARHVASGFPDCLASQTLILAERTHQVVGRLYLASLPSEVALMVPPVTMDERP